MALLADMDYAKPLAVVTSTAQEVTSKGDVLLIIIDEAEEVVNESAKELSPLPADKDYTLCSIRVSRDEVGDHLRPLAFDLCRRSRLDLITD
jgi:hypothetical protein